MYVIIYLYDSICMIYTRIVYVYIYIHIAPRVLMPNWVGQKSNQSILAADQADAGSEHLGIFLRAVCLESPVSLCVVVVYFWAGYRGVSPGEEQKCHQNAR